MDTEPHTSSPGASRTDHEAHEQQLVAGLRELIRLVEASDYRDARGRLMRDSPAFHKVQALVDQFGGPHERLRPADPSSTPPEYSTWHTGP